MKKAFDRQERVARRGRVALVRLWKDGTAWWAVLCPDQFGRATYYTQSTEAAARDFFARVVAAEEKTK